MKGGGMSGDCIEINGGYNGKQEKNGIWSDLKSM
jgi:hypothetical protein